MQSVIITGVSRGLGAALFDGLYERGDRILAVGRRFTESQLSLAAADPDRVLLRHADLADPVTLPDAVELRDLLRNGDAALVHNAAVVGPIGAVGSLPGLALAESVAVNLTAPMMLTDAFLGADPGGRLNVLFISSAAAHKVVGGWSAYCSTKAGAEMFFAVLAEQYADQPRVRVASVNPGQMDTAMQTDIRSYRASGAYFPDSARFHDAYEQHRLADPGQVAQRIIDDYLQPL